jgi:Lon protease-like protein
MTKPIRIPLFPLDVVLFPGMALPLHIFEPRYKLMIQRCIQEKLEFGVILALAEGLAKAGTTAAIVSVVRTYPDGKMDILTEGRSRFQPISVIEEQPYFEATVEYLEDQKTEENLEEQARLLDLYDKCHWLIRGRAPDPIELRPGATLAFQIAASLPFELEYRQALLERRAEWERQVGLLQRLSEWLPQLQKLQYARRKGAGNGHGMS